MDIRILRYFLAVAREETMTKAAQVLHITQPTLSRQLTQLEDELGVKLFEYQERRMLLTSEGMLLRRRAEEILEMVYKTEQELTQLEENIQGTISVGYGEIAPMSLLSDCLGQFCKVYPQVHFELVSATADIVKEYIDRGLLDIGLLLEPIDTKQYDTVRLDTVDFYVVWMRPDDPMAQKEIITPADLAGKPLLLPRRRVEAARNWLGPYCKEENLRYLVTLPNMASVLTMQGHGYWLAPKDCLPFYDPSKLTFRSLSGVTQWHSILAWKRGLPTTPAVRRFIEFAQCFPGIGQPTK